MPPPYPPQLPPATRNSMTPQAGNHADDHNKVAAALAQMVEVLGDTEADGTPGRLSESGLSATFAQHGVGQREVYSTAALEAVAENAANHLTIPTYDGSGQAVHPSVLHIPEGFGGYRYWMAMTPYPGVGDDGYENPSILRSQDGLTWAVPTGVTNPLVAKPAGSGNFNSDPVLVHANGRLYMFYRTVDKTFAGAEERISYLVTDDGVTWEAPVVSFTHALAAPVVSPAVTYDDATGLWHMWGVRTAPSPNALTHWTATSPDGPWTGEEDATGFATSSGNELWHIDIKQIDGEYVMFAYESAGGAGTFGGRLRRSVSRDGITWDSDAHSVLYMNVGKWDANLYKATFTPIRVDGADGYRLWYGAYATGNGWRIGHAVASLIGPDATMRDAALGINGYTAGDTFNKPANAASPGSLNTGQAWTVAGGTPGINANGQLYSASGTAVVTVDARSNDVDVSVDFPVISVAGDQSEIYLYARRSNSTNWLRFGIYGGAGGAVYSLTKDVAAVVTNVRNGINVPVPVNGDRLRMVVKGTSVKCYVNDRLIISETVSDVPASNLVGVQVNGTKTADNFACRAL